MPKRTYKIGTRGSLLAVTQCNQVKAELERLTGDSFELVLFKTQGDIITNAPLWQLDGKDFFTKELDEALLDGKVDLVVHSYKDLGSVRPEGLKLAAITKRTFAHDILLIKKETVQNLATKNDLSVGTSSPRRMINLQNNLSEFLPQGAQLKIVPKMLRGNVNTRISKLVSGEYDAIVVALAGIERLSKSETSKKELTPLLDGMTFMILPQSAFPSSASQGALALECVEKRNDGGELLEKLKLVNDITTQEEVSRERVAFNRYGGGCHLAVGINVKKIQQFFIHTHLGEIEGNKIVKSELEGRPLPLLTNPPKVFSGHLPDDELVIKKENPAKIKDNSHIYVTSKYCYSSINSKHLSLWTAGIKSMKDLAKKGYWVNGTADARGDEELALLRSSQVLSMMIDTEGELIVLSNKNAQSSIGFVQGCYERILNENLSESFKNKINSIEVFFWTSFPQYQMYIEVFPQIKNRIHACGLGKTYKQFKENNINVIAFASMDEFNNWVKI